MTVRWKTPLVCSVGSTDPTAGAGLFADAAVFGRLGVPAAYVVAGVTAQNSAAVSAVHALPARAILGQLRDVWHQVTPSAVRIGLMPDAQATAAVTRFLASLRSRPPVVVDPVMASTSGRRFAGHAEITALARLFGLATIVTPNVPEAAALTGLRVRTVDEAERAALALASSSKCAVLVTGGHLRSGDRIVDVLAFDGKATRFASRRLARDVRGTGCILASALAAALARGDTLEPAIRRARSFVRAAMTSARPVGRGRPQLWTGRATGVPAPRA